MNTGNILIREQQRRRSASIDSGLYIEAIKKAAHQSIRITISLNNKLINNIKKP
jgi:hypothetical protein